MTLAVPRAPQQTPGGIQPDPTPIGPVQNNTPMCPSFVGARVARVTRLNQCGAPMYGKDNMATTIGMVTVTFETEVEEGEALDTRNLNGDLCVAASTPDSMTGINVSIEFCQVDPAVFAILNPTWKVVRRSRNPNNRDAPIVGWRQGQSFSDECGFALELWPKAMGTVGSVCETDPNPDPLDPWQTNGYFLLPYVVGKAPDEWELTGDEVATFTLQGRTRGGSPWGYGPYIVTRDEAGMPSPLLNQIEDGSGRGNFPNVCYGWSPEMDRPYRINRDPDHFHAEITSYPPPEPKCGAQPLVAPQLEFVTPPGPHTLQTVCVKLKNVDEVAPKDPETGLRSAVLVSWGDGTNRQNITHHELEDNFTLCHEYDASVVGMNMIRAVTLTGVYGEVIGAPGATLVLKTEPPNQWSLNPGKQRQIKAYMQVAGRPVDAQSEVTRLANWTSDKPDIVSVNNWSNKGVIYAHKPGTATITAEFGGKKVERKITVVPTKIKRLEIVSERGDTVGDNGVPLPLFAQVIREDGSAQFVRGAVWRLKNLTPGLQAQINTEGELTVSNVGTSQAPGGTVVAEYTENGVKFTDEFQFKARKVTAQRLQLEVPGDTHDMFMGDQLQTNAWLWYDDDSYKLVNSHANTEWAFTTLPNPGSSVSDAITITDGLLDAKKVGDGYIQVVYRPEPGKEIRPNGPDDPWFMRVSAKAKPESIEIVHPDNEHDVTVSGEPLSLIARVMRQGETAPEEVTIKPGATWTWETETGSGAVAEVKKNLQTGNADVYAYQASTDGTNGTGKVKVVYKEGDYPEVSTTYDVTVHPGVEATRVRVTDPETGKDNGTVEVEGEIQLKAEAEFGDGTPWVDISHYPDPPLTWSFVPDDTKPGDVYTPIAKGKVKGKTAGKGQVKATLHRDGQEQHVGTFDLEITAARGQQAEPQQAEEPHPHSVSMTLDDAPGGELSVNWGDGTPPETVTGSGPHAHTYAKPGDYVATVKDAAGNEVAQQLFAVTSPPKTTATRSSRSRKKS